MKRILLLLSLLIVIVTGGTHVSAQTVLTDVWKDKDHHIAAKKIQFSGSLR
jgi:hypothetical protein